jgi:hypothetical protein
MINENRLYHIYYCQGDPKDWSLSSPNKKKTDWLPYDIDSAWTQAQARLSQDPDLEGWFVMWIWRRENKKDYSKTEPAIGSVKPVKRINPDDLLTWVAECNAEYEAWMLKKFPTPESREEERKRNEEAFEAWKLRQRKQWFTNR